MKYLATLLLAFVSLQDSDLEETRKRERQRIASKKPLDKAARSTYVRPESLESERREPLLKLPVDVVYLSVPDRPWSGKDWKKDVEISPYFHDLNRNKLSVNLNLNHPQGLELLKKLVRISHGLVQNFSLRVPKKLGIDYESLRQVKPDLVYLAMPTAGLSGPLKDIIGYAPVYTSLGGIESLVGYSDGTVTGMIMIGPGDPNAAIHGALAMLAALYHHERTGEGQFIELSQIEAITHLQGEAVAEYSMNGRVMGPQGNQHRRMAPHGIYPCTGQDQWVSIAVDTDETWRKFCELMGHV